MKHIYIFVISLFTAVSASATVITVDNSIPSPGQYTSLQAAINAANPGDSLYISGSVNSYGAVTLNKRLILFGAGYNPAKQNPLVSITGTITLDTVTSVSGASGSGIYGLTIGNTNDNYGVKNLTIERNYFSGTSFSLNVNASGIVLRNNVFNNGSVYLNGSANILIENNLMNNCAIHYDTQPSVVINHNTFINTASTYYSLYQISFATVTNNIFWGQTPLGNTVVNNVFNNNLTFQTSNDVIPGASNSGSGNLVSTNPQFVNAPSPAIDFSFNYNVAAASAAHNAGTDGTDLGIFGGASAMPNLTGMPAIPQMVEMLIQNPVVAPAGNLNVTFKAKKNN